MIDPITISAAFAIAKSTIAGVQEAIQMGKDLQECSGDLIKFFEMRDTVAKAAVQDKGKKPRSDMGQALDTVMQAKALRDAEKKLKEQLKAFGGTGFISLQRKFRIIDDDGLGPAGGDLHSNGASQACGSAGDHHHIVLEVLAAHRTVSLRRL